MSRLDRTFEALRARGDRALVVFFTAGDPSLETTARLVIEAERRGADVIELGIPFSDPVADGPVIQRAAERALAKGIGMPQVLDYVRGFRVRNGTTPIVLMGYANPVERYGIARFVADAGDRKSVV